MVALRYEGAHPPELTTADALGSFVRGAPKSPSWTALPAFTCGSDPSLKATIGELFRHATRYTRATGFFAGSVLGSQADGLQSFVARGGTIRVVCSPILSQSDLHPLQDAVFAPHKCLSWWNGIPDALLSRQWSHVLAYLVVRRVIRIQIAVVRNRPDSLFHEKVAVFEDSHGYFVALTGSANDTESGIAKNFERMDLFRNWVDGDESRRAALLRAHVDGLWQRRVSELQLMDLHDAFRRGVICGAEERPTSTPVLGAPMPRETLSVPATLTLRPHQKAAVNAWGDAGGRGLLEMATGSGKTITALTAAAMVFARLGSGLVVVIVVPFIHLADQWTTEARRFGLSPIRCAEGTKNWLDSLNSGIYALNEGHRSILSVIATTSTFCSESFQRQLARIRKNTLFVADEVHNLGSRAAAALLPQTANLRMGLSATPDRWFDEDGTRRLESYFGGVVFRYTLADALRDDILTPYQYEPITVSLTEQEEENYADVSRLIARHSRRNDDDGMSDALRMLLIRRARIVASASNKIRKLRDLLREMRGSTHVLVYCGDGSVDSSADESEARQVDAVVDMIGRDLGMKCASYTSATPPDRRRTLLSQFTEGFIQVLVAIRCLDEGVDIPLAKTAYILASSTNPRQFIQRRGRLLRRAPGKSHARIFDFFVVPEEDGLVKGSEQWTLGRTLLESQIRRAKEFADLALNGPSARSELVKIAARLDLLSVWGEK